MQLGGEAHLGVDDAVGGEVERRTRRRRVRCDSSVCITASVCSNVARYCSRSLVGGAGREPRLQIGRVVVGERPADLVGQFEHGGDPQATVEMIVQQHLGDGDRRPGDVDQSCSP